MVHEIKEVETMKARCLTERCALPEQIVEPDPPLSPGGSPGVLPARQRDPHKMQIRIRMLPQEALDIIAVVRVGEDPHLVVGGQKPGPIPGDARL
jgi:hypothetical protein